MAAPPQPPLPRSDPGWPRRLGSDKVSDSLCGRVKRHWFCCQGVRYQRAPHISGRCVCTSKVDMSLKLTCASFMDFDVAPRWQGRIQDFSQGMAPSDGLVPECYWMVYFEWYLSFPGVGASPSTHLLNPRLVEDGVLAHLRFPKPPNLFKKRMPIYTFMEVRM